MNPLVSIIIPVYNVEKYLKQCIDSVLNQAYNNIEVILVDDGSTDHSPLICDDFAQADNRITVIHKTNHGAADSRNIGLHSAKGEFVLFIDSDDFLIGTDSLGKLIDLFMRYYEEIDFLIFNYSKYYQKQNAVIPNRKYPNCEELNKYDKFRFFVHSGHFPMQPWTKLIKREFLVKNKIDFISGIIAEDIPWFIDLINNCNNFIIANEYMVSYRKQVAGAVTSNFSYKKFNNLIFVVDHCIKKVQSNQYDPALTSSIYTFMAYEYAILIANLANVESSKRNKYLEWFKQNKWLLQYSGNQKNILTKYCLNICGFRVTASLLDFYIRKFVNKDL